MTAMLSASPLREGERIEVRGWIARRRDDFQPSPYGRERRQTLERCTTRMTVPERLKNLI